MKKKLLVLSVLALSGISAATLASCDKFVGGSTTTSTPSESVPRTVTGISVTGQNTVYGIGDSIAPGASARVAINYSDGTSLDSTSTAKFDFSAVDASKAGKYTVKVTCQGKETSYEVEVKEYVFTGIEADTSKADLNYHLYTVYNFDDVVISALYKHPVTNEVTKKVLNNADVAFKVTDSNNTEIGTQFPAIGDYNVEASYNDAKCNFAVKCVPVDAKTIAEAMEVASKTESSISSGSAVYTSTYGIGSESGDSYEIHTDSYDYVYGNSFVKVKKENSYNGEKRNLYYSLKSNGEPFVVAVDLDENGNETGTPYIPTDLEFNPKAIDAQYLPLNIFKDGTKYNGVYNTINALYKELEGVVGDPYQELGECSHLDNATGFKFGYNRLRSAYNRWYYERVTVEFTLTEAGAINKAYINIDKYISEENPAYGETDYEAGTALPSDLPIEIKEKQDEAGLTKKYFVFKDGADTTPSDSSNWKFNQESGVKASDDENPYLASKITVSDFKIFDANNKELNDGERISLDLDNGNSVKDEGNHRFELTFSIGNVLPETANIDLDAIDVEVSGVGKDGHIVGDFDYKYATISNYDGSITLRFNRPGDYDVTFKTSSVTKTIHYSVDYEAPLTIEGTVHNGEKDSSFSPESSFAMYKSNKIYIGANIGDNNGGNGDAFEPGFTAVVDKTTAKLEKTTLNVNGKDVECYAFTATEAGDYVITITGAKPDSDRAAATSTLKINVADNPTLTSILAKYDNKYEAVVSEDEIYSLEFTDNKFTVYNKYDHTKYAEYDYTYDAETRTFVCIPGGNASGIDKNFELTMSNYYVLSLVDVDTKASYILKKPTSDITDEDLALLKGKYTGALATYGYSWTFAFVPGEEKGTGSLVVTENNGWDDVDYTYTYEFDTKTRKLVPTYTGTSKNHPLKSGVVSINNDSQLVFTYANANIVLESQNADYSQMFNGTYETTAEYNGMSQVFEFQFTANTDDAKTGTLVCITDGDSSKSGTYTYSLDEATGAIKVTKISGKKKYIEDCLSFVNGKLYLTKYNNNFELSKKGGNETPDKFEIPKEMYGTWSTTQEGGYDPITISENGVQFANYGYDETPIVSINGNTIVVNDSYYQKVTITLIDSKTLNVVIYGSTIVYKNSSSTQTSIPEEMYGTWSTTQEGGYDPITISENGVQFANYGYDETPIVSINGNTIVVNDSYYQKVTITLIDSKTLNVVIYGSTVVYTKDDVEGVLEVPTELQGTYVGFNPNSSGNVTIEVGEKTVKCGEYTYTISSVEDGTYKFVDETAPDCFVLLVVGADQKITFTTETTDTFEIHLKGSSTVVEIDESLQGTWKDEANNITLVISASSVNWNDIECTGVAYSEGNLSFTYNDAEYIGGINTTTNKLEIRTGTTEWYTFSKQTPSESNGEVDLSSYAGWYVNGNDQIAVISSGIIIGKDTYVIDSKSLVDGVLTIEASLNSTSISITITGNSLVYNEVTYTKQVD